MKKLLLSFILAVPALAFAQKYELGVSGGYNYCGRPSISMPPMYSFIDREGKGGYAVGVSITKNLKNKKAGDLGYKRSVWQVGLKLDAQQIRVRGIIYNNMVMYLGNELHSFAPLKQQTIRLAEPAVSPMLFINRKLNFSKSHLYFGVCAGPAFTIIQPERSSYNGDVYLPKGVGYTVGGQIGYTRDISKRFSLNAELSGRYYNISITDRQGKTNSYEVTSWEDIVAPITIGLRYNFGR